MSEIRIPSIFALLLTSLLGNHILNLYCMNLGNEKSLTLSRQTWNLLAISSVSE